MNKRHRILGIGTPIIDHLLKVSHEFLEALPGAKGGMQPVDQQTFDDIIKSSGASDILIAGGSCSNTIKGLARLGHETFLIGKIGKDLAAERFLERLHPLNITPLLHETNTPTAQVAALIAPNGERTFRCLLNASLEMSGKDLNPEHFKNMDLVHIEGYSLLCESLTKRAMQLAKAAGALVSFDLSSFEIVEKYKELIFELLKEYVDIVFANQEEVFALTQKAPEEGCAILAELCHVAVVFVGKKGSVVGNEQKIISCEAYPIDQPLDTTGAGDLFASGFIHGYLHQHPLKEAARFGALLGSSVIQILGAEIPSEVWGELKKTIPH